MIRTAAAIALIALAAPAAAERAALAPEAAKRLLKSQGFWRPLEPPPHRFRLIGSIQGPKNRYDLYFYDWTNPKSLHGRQGVVLIRNGRTYVGTYDASLDGCRVQRRTLICWDSWQGKRTSQQVLFRAGEPPRRILLGGELTTLRR